MRSGLIVVCIASLGMAFGIGLLYKGRGTEVSHRVIVSGRSHTPPSKRETNAIIPGVRVEARLVNGSFTVAARVNEKPLIFIVDTGATIVSIGESTARELGLLWLPICLDAMTAAGKACSYATRVPLVDVQGIVMKDLEARVLPNFPGSLLGMNFISDLQRFEIMKDRIVMEGHPQRLRSAPR